MNYNKNIAQAVLQIAEKQPNGPALLSPDGDTVTYKVLADSVRNVSSAISELSPARVALSLAHGWKLPAGSSVGLTQESPDDSTMYL